MGLQTVSFETLNPLDQKLLAYAVKSAKESECSRRHVGAVVRVTEDLIVTSGFNGRGCLHGDHCSHKGMEPGTEKPCNGEHAEIMALEASDNLVPPDSTLNRHLYVTLFPCIDCCIEILKRRHFRRIFYIEDYGNNLGKDLLLSAGIELIKVIMPGGEIDGLSRID